MAFTTFDSTLKPLEASRFLKSHDKFAKKMLKKLHFNNTELESLMIIYHKLQKCHGSSKGITRDQYLEVLHKALDMTDVYIMNLVMTALDPKSRGNFVTMETFLNSLSLFLRGNLEEKIRFCFSVYDSHNTGMLGREVLFRFLRYSILSTGGPTDAEEMVKDMIEVVMQKLDLDRDGRISFNDYRSSVLKEPCWLEFLGPCLPERLKPLDVYNQTLDETRYLKRYDKFTKKMATETHFTEEEVQTLILIFYRFLTNDKKTMTNEQILSVLIDTFEMTNENMTNKVAMALDWKTGGQKITKARWLRMLSLFLRGSLREKIKFCFSVYDNRRTGFLSRELLFRYLRKAFFNTDGNPDEESTRDIVDILLKKMDHDRDGKISFKDYKKSVLRQPCMLEFLGQCLPDKRACIRFSTSWATNVVLN